MKRMLILLTTILVLAMSANAQGVIDFADLPDTPGIATPNPMPNGYAGLNWTGFYYVDPFAWSGAGPGFKHKEWIMGTNVVFAPYACPSFACFASLTWQGNSQYAPPPPERGFQLISAHTAAGYPTTGPGGSPLVVTAYYNGKYVGSQRYMMTTDVQKLDFPTSWGTVTQVVFQGSAVLYDVTVYVSR